MKSFKNLMLLLLAVSFLSSCIVQDQGRRPGRGNGYYKKHPGKHKGHYKQNNGHKKQKGRPGYW